MTVCLRASKLRLYVMRKLSPGHVWPQSVAELLHWISGKCQCVAFSDGQYGTHPSECCRCVFRETLEECLQPFPASRSFPVSQLFTSGGQSIRASASSSVLPMNIQGWFPLGLTGLISLQSKGLSRIFSSTTIWKHQFFSTQPSLWSSSHICTWLQKSHNFDYTDLCQQSDVSAF